MQKKLQPLPASICRVEHVVMIISTCDGKCEQFTEHTGPVIRRSVTLEQTRATPNSAPPYFSVWKVTCALRAVRTSWFRRKHHLFLQSLSPLNRWNGDSYPFIGDDPRLVDPPVADLLVLRPMSIPFILRGYVSVDWYSFASHTFTVICIHTHKTLFIYSWWSPLGERNVEMVWEHSLHSFHIVMMRNVILFYH